MSPSEASPGSAEQASAAGPGAAAPGAAKQRSSAAGGAQPSGRSGSAPAGQTQPGSATKPGSAGRSATPRRGRGQSDPAQGGATRPDDETRPHAVVKDPAVAERGGRIPPAKADGAEQAQPGQPSPWSRDSVSRDSVSRDSANTRTTSMEPVNGYDRGPGYTPAGAVPPGYAAAPGGGTATATAPPAQSSRQMARRARLKVSHLGPWSVFKVSLTFSLCMFIVLLVAVAALWAVLDSAGVFNSIVDAANTLTNDNKETSIAEWLTFNRVMVIAVVLGAANVIAFTLLSTIGSLLYNLCSDFVGGIEVTLVER